MGIERKKNHIQLSEELQDLVLEEFKKKLRGGTLTDTGLNTLVNFLMKNGWRIDPNDLPKDIQDKLTARISARELKDGDPDVPEGMVQ